MKVWINYHYLQLAWASWTCLQFKRRAINSAQLLPSDIPTQRTRNTHTLRFSHFLPSCKKNLIWFCADAMEHMCSKSSLHLKSVLHSSHIFSTKSAQVSPTISLHSLRLVMRFHACILMLAQVALSQYSSPYLLLYLLIILLSHLWFGNVIWRGCYFWYKLLCRS